MSKQLITLALVFAACVVAVFALVGSPAQLTTTRRSITQRSPATSPKRRSPTGARPARTCRSRAPTTSDLPASASRPRLARQDAESGFHRLLAGRQVAVGEVEVAPGPGSELGGDRYVGRRRLLRRRGVGGSSRDSTTGSRSRGSARLVGRSRPLGQGAAAQGVDADRHVDAGQPLGRHGREHHRVDQPLVPPPSRLVHDRGPSWRRRARGRPARPSSAPNAARRGRRQARRAACRGRRTWRRRRSRGPLSRARRRPPGHRAGRSSGRRRHRGARASGARPPRRRDRGPPRPRSTRRCCCPRRHR